MRSYEERLAEIQRRSEKIRKERSRRRKHIMAGCISMALCGALASVFVLPDMLYDGSDGISGNSGSVYTQGYFSEGAYENVICTVTKIKVTGGNISHTFTETADIEKISRQLVDCISQNELGGYSEEKTSAAGSDNKDESSNFAGENYSGIISDLALQPYTITLTIADGRQMVYYLVGNTLRIRDGFQTVSLTPGQAQELKATLGILTLIFVQSR